MEAGVSAAQGCGLLVRLRLQRLINMSIHGGRWSAGGKGQANLILLAVMAPLVAYQAHVMGIHAIEGAERALGAAAVAGFVSTVLFVLFVALVAEGVSLKNKDLSRLDWDLEWLMALPVSLGVLQVMKVIEQTVLNVFGWTTIFPLLSAYCWHQGLRWSAPIVSFVLSLNILLLLGVSRVVVETAVRRYCSVWIVRNFQAFCTLVAVGAMALALAPALAASNESQMRHPFVWRWYGAAGNWPAWLPTGAAARLIGMLPSRPAVWMQGMGMMIVVTLVVFAVEWILLRAMVAGGVIEAGGILRGRVPTRRESQWQVRRKLSSALAGIVGKDLHLLWRDRNMLIGTLVVPIVILGMQLAFNPAVLREGFFDYRHIAAMAFGVAAYVLMFSAFSVVSAEGQALWLLYSVPRYLHRLLLEKILLWGGFACAYAVVLLGYGWLRLPFSWLFVWLSSYVLAAVILCAMVGGALGVFGADPLNPDAPRRGSIAQLYTFMLLAGAIGAGGIYVAPGNWHRFVILIVVAFLVYGLWEKVRERLPYLLDPGARPKSRVTLADGLAAALLFFVLQILYLFFVLKRLGIVPSGPWIALGFVASGVLSVSLVLAARWKAKTVRLKDDLGLTIGYGGKSVIANAALCAVGAIAVGLFYLYLLGHWPWLHRIAQQAMKEEVDLLDAKWGMVLAVVAAPFVEELIFRGMIFKSLRRNHGMMISVLGSGLLFAVVHDPLSVPPVFVLGCAAAIAFEKSGSIWSAMLVHGAYNAAIAMGQPLLN